MSYMRQEIREVVDCLGIFDPADPESTYAFSKDTYRAGDYCSGRAFTQMNYWFIRRDGTQSIVFSVGKNHKGESIREVEIQYTDPNIDHECPARYPKHLRHRESFTGREWADRMIDWIVPHVPECVEKVVWAGPAGRSPEECDRGIHFPSVNPDAYIKNFLQGAGTIWVRKGGQWEDRSPEPQS